ncbi:MAG: tRNA threonylcarbamoyladenosine dehydratase [Candidatus Sericytochromatia bacterium]|nr:tRNA threonylcarbamoyladenosine dehydratase [Candidatus Sericytochromatia bacterium]
MLHRFSRLELLVGREGYARLKDARVAVFGLGGVGSYAAEALARAAVGELTIVDFDLVCATNVNRQLHAMIGTIGKPKSEVMAERIKKINPHGKVIAHQTFYNAERAEDLLAGPDGRGYDYVLDCIDNVTAKLHLIATAHGRGMPVIAAMGAASKLDPTRIKVGDISETQTCSLARDVRKELRRKYGITSGIKAVWSSEKPITPAPEVADCTVKCICPPTHEKGVNDCELKNQINGTISYMPAMFGLMMAGVALQDLLAGTPYAPPEALEHPCGAVFSPAGEVLAPPAPERAACPVPV